MMLRELCIRYGYQKLRRSLLLGGNGMSGCFQWVGGDNNLLGGFSQDTTLKKGIFKNHILELNLTQNTASLFTPSFRNIHPGINTTLSNQWNKNKKLQLRQDFIAGFFYHKSFQSVVQLYSEFNFKIKILDKFFLSPLVIGGGYFLFFFKMQNFFLGGKQYFKSSHYEK